MRCLPSGVSFGTNRIAEAFFCIAVLLIAPTDGLTLQRFLLIKTGLIYTSMTALQSTKRSTNVAQAYDVMFLKFKPKNRRTKLQNQ